MASALPGNAKPKHIMMSYAWTGTQNLVYEVAEQLKNEGIPVWMDIRNGLGGNINDGMAEAVENSAAVCFFMTEEYQESKNCKKELEYADKLEIPLIPCRCRANFKPSKWLGIISAGLVWYDFRDLSDKPVNATMNKLINFIQTNILKIAPTTFPDLEGRTQPVIFRNRHQFRTTDEVVIREKPNCDYNSEEYDVHRGGCASSNRMQNNTNCDDATLSCNDVSAESAALDSGINHRFTSSDDHKGDLGKLRPPLEGYEKEPLVSLEEAVRPLELLFSEDIRRFVYIAKSNSANPADGLTIDESAAIHLYTMQWSQSDDSFYVHLNRVLRAVNRQAVIPWFRYLKLFLTGLFKLPTRNATVWRGVRGDISSQYSSGQTVIWWGISSCTSSVSVMEGFIGKSGNRTLFAIETMNARCIRHHSIYENEDEIVLLPGIYLRVLSALNPAAGLTIIQMREEQPPFPLLAAPFAVASPQNEPVLHFSRSAEHQYRSSTSRTKSPAKKTTGQSRHVSKRK